MTQKTNYGITTADTDIVKQLQEMYKKLGIPLNGMSKELEEILDLCKAYSEKMEEKNPYKTLMEMQQKAKEQLSTDIDVLPSTNGITMNSKNFTKTKPALLPQN